MHMEDNVSPDCIRYSNFRQLFDNCHLSSYLMNFDLCILDMAIYREYTDNGVSYTIVIAV